MSCKHKSSPVVGVFRYSSIIFVLSMMSVRPYRRCRLWGTSTICVPRPATGADFTRSRRLTQSVVVFKTCLLHSHVMRVCHGFWEVTPLSNRSY